MVFEPDFRHRSCRFSLDLSGNTATMLCDMTQLSDLVPEQEANCPSNMHPLNLMHSSLPGSGYDVKFVLLPVFHTRPGLSHPVGGGGGGGGGGGLPVVVEPPVVEPPVVVEPPQVLPVVTTLLAALKFDASVE